jgi:hypothetical protein
MRNVEEAEVSALANVFYLASGVNVGRILPPSVGRNLTPLPLVLLFSLVLWWPRRRGRGLGL